MRASFSPRGTAATMALLGMLGALPARAEEVTFRWDPPDGTAFTVRTRSTKTQSSGEGVARVTRTETIAKVVIRRTLSGTDYAVTQVSLEGSRDGHPIVDPLSQALSGVPLTYSVDRQGRLEAIRGYDTLIEKVRALVPSEMHARLASVLNEKGLLEQARSDWDGRFGDLAGRTVHVGDVWAARSEMPLPTGARIPYSTRTTLAATEGCGGNRCVRLEADYGAESAALTEMANRVLAQASKETGLPHAPPLSTSTISGTYRIVMEPSTMLIHGEALRRSVRLESNGEPVLLVDEERETTFEFGESSASPERSINPTRTR